MKPSKMNYSDDPDPMIALMAASSVMQNIMAEYLHRYAFLEEEVDTADLRAKLEEILASHHGKTPLPLLSYEYVRNFLGALETNLSMIQEQGLDYWYGSSP